MATTTVENYLKQLYLEQRGTADLVPMGRLAAAMNVVPGTATSMVKTLADAGLVDYEPRGGVRLTERGERLALHVLRRHRLVELFLVQVLGLDWSEVHEEAEELEHVISDKVLERIDTLLGHPRTDPHGDPIPPPSGHHSESLGESLATCAVGQQLRVTRILAQDRPFLQLIERRGLRPGAAVTVTHREPAADSVDLRVNDDGSVTTLGAAAAAKVLVGPA